MGLDVYTMPTGVAEDYLAAAPSGDVSTLADRTELTVEAAPGVDFERERVDRLWRIPTETKAGVHDLSTRSVGELTGDEVRSILADHGAGDVFAEFSTEDRERITADGKLPKYEPWADRVRAGKASWDGLLTEAALGSFTKDQKALDDRIRSLL